MTSPIASYNSARHTTPEQTRRRRPDRAHLLKSLTHLAALQYELAVSDLNQVRQRAKASLMMGLVAVVLAIASLSVLLFGVAEWISLATGLTRPATLCIVGSVGFGVFMIVGWDVRRRVRNASRPLRKTRRELKRNFRAAQAALDQLFSSDD